MITPVPYIGTGSNAQVILGHYAVAQTSGAIAATPTALDVHASIRWAPTVSSYFLTLMRVKVGWGVISAVTTAVRIAYQASIARAFSSDFTTAATAISMAAGSGRMRANMAPSQMGANGPRIATTAPQTVFTYTLDAAPIGMQNWTTSRSSNTVGTVVIIQVGDAGEPRTLYEWTALGQHPVVLSNNEGVVIQLVHTGWAAGTISLYDQWEWCESLTF